MKTLNMKKKIIALIACILVAGTIGVSAKTTTTQTAQCPNGTTANTAAYNTVNTNTNCPASAVQAAATAASSSKACPFTNSANANAASTPNSVAGATNSTCPRAAANTTVSGCQNNTNCTNGSCTTSSCANGSCLTSLLNCANGGCSASGCTNNANCTSGNCLANLLNCKNGNVITFTYGKNGSCPLTNGTISKPSAGSTASVPNTTSKPATSVPSTNSKPTATVPSTGSSSGSRSSFASFQSQVIQLVNEQRAANGLKPLTANSQLNNTATLKSQDMAKLNYFDHTSPTYGSPFDMMKKYGISYRTAGENIAMGQTTPAQVMQGWMNSPGHRANILNASFTQIGVGIAKNAQGQLIWTQQFIG